MARKKKRQPEKIPDSDDLYRRIPPDQYERGKIAYTAFLDYETSVNWEEYSTPEKTVKGFLDKGFGVASKKKVYIFFMIRPGAFHRPLLGIADKKAGCRLGSTTAKSTSIPIHIPIETKRV